MYIVLLDLELLYDNFFPFTGATLRCKRHHCITRLYHYCSQLLERLQFFCTITCSCITLKTWFLKIAAQVTNGEKKSPVEANHTDEEKLNLLKLMSFIIYSDLFRFIQHLLVSSKQHGSSLHQHSSQCEHYPFYQKILTN